MSVLGRFLAPMNALLLLLAGCGAQTALPAVPTAKPLAVPGVPLSITRGMSGIAANLQGAYAVADWGAVRSQFVTADAAHDLLAAMHRWNDLGVRNLHVGVVYAAKGPTRYVATMSFTQDPAAVPEYFIYAFQTVQNHLRIADSVTGLYGNSYRNLTWQITRSKHFVIYHSPYQLHGADQRAVANLEYERTAFENKFGVRVTQTIRYYLFPVQSMMAPLSHNACGRSSEVVGCTFPYVQPPIIMTSLWPTYHEPIHAYEVAMEPKGYEAPLFIGEGTAVALEDREVDPRLSDYCSDVRYIPLDFCAQQALPDVNPLTLLQDSGFSHAQQGDAYVLGGSFVKYLILKWGYRRFRDFYYALAAQPKDTEHDYNVAGEKVYRQPIRSLIHAWTTHLCPHGC